MSFKCCVVCWLLSTVRYIPLPLQTTEAADSSPRAVKLHGEDELLSGPSHRLQRGLSMWLVSVLSFAKWAALPKGVVYRGLETGHQPPLIRPAVLRPGLGDTPLPTATHSLPTPEQCWTVLRHPT